MQKKFELVIVFSLMTTPAFFAHAAEVGTHRIPDRKKREVEERPRVPEWVAADAARRRHVEEPKPECPIQKFQRAIGNGEDRLRTPHGIALGKDAIYAVDTDKQRIVKYAFDGRQLTKWALKSAAGRAQTSRGAAVDKDGNVYVAVEKDTSIYKYSSEGKLLKRWRVDEPGVKYPDNQHKGNWDLAVSDAGEIFGVDPNTRRINVYDTEGKLLRTFGGGMLGFAVGIGLSPGPDQKLYIADTSNNRILVASLDGNIGLFKEPIKNVYDVDFDENGDVYATSNLDHAIYRYREDGTFVAKISAPRGEPGAFERPRHMVIRGCTIYVADGDNNRIAVVAP